MAYGWAAFPYTLYALDCNSNDSFVAMVCVWALVALRSAPGRGLLVGLGAAAKFAPLALAPLFATGAGGRHRWRGAVIASVVVLLVVVASFAPFVPDGGVRALYDRTLGYQAGRASPFSIWGQHASLAGVWTVVKVLTVALAVAVAFVPRGVRTPVQVAALGAAVLVALQLAVAHWFYLYIVWFTPFVLVALFARYDAAPGPAVEAEPPVERSIQPALA
jgi:hypothetical protein